MTLEPLPAHTIPTARPEAAPEPGLADRIRVAWLLAQPSPHTRQAYARDLEMWAGFLDGLGVDVLAARRVHVDAWTRARQAAGDASSTRARRLASVSSFYSFAVGYAAENGREDLGLHNPAASVKRPPKASAPTRALDKSEYLDLLAAAEDAAPAWGPRDAAVVALLGMGGFRVATLTSMDVGDLGVHGAHRTITYTGKGDKRRTAPLVPAVLGYLDAHHAARRAVAPVAAWEPLLLANDGGRLSDDQVTRILARCARAAGLRAPAQVRPHVLRATYATLARAAGVSLWDLQEAMDHADPRTTQRYEQGEHRLANAPAYAVATFLLSA
ncbi:tyrosine-type recombinase/integrase [Nocardiopsis changdeensis]|uniref:Tyrosine-type recombinase/integrase n=1 Tax=Nocardiopsis changdeensis TaxID=2831969 RepID=A0A975KS48_9ACTN|nr:MULTISPECIES: tyrosine-type recombinase/integrase [Nocardiopsis]QUX26505.1 tyrosine-type recombinase/integrase [Nocardiopsis changdeensis]QYX40777.1 tyrosine-type recombinase/integrase [Nocardiopsis sp. MT53]